MIVVYLFILFNSSGSQNPVPPLADMESCQRLRTVYGRGECTQVLIPAPSREAFIALPNKIQEPKKP